MLAFRLNAAPGAASQRPMKWPRSKLRGVFWMRPEGHKKSGALSSSGLVSNCQLQEPAGSASGGAVRVGVDLVDLGRCEGSGLDAGMETALVLVSDDGILLGLAQRDATGEGKGDEGEEHKGDHG